MVQGMRLSWQSGQWDSGKLARVSVMMVEKDCWEFLLRSIDSYEQAL